MTTTTRNEAAKRLLDHLRLNRAFEARDLIGMRNRLAAVQAEERRATVKRIRAAAWDKIGRYSGEYTIKIFDLQAILEEAAR